MRRRGLLLSLTAALALVTTREAAAGEPRDGGFYLRLGFGASVLLHSSSAYSHQRVVDAGGQEQTATSRVSYFQHPAGFVGDAAIGWSPSPRIVIAAYYAHHPYLRVSYGDIEGSTIGVNARKSTDVRLSLYGVLFNVYPDPAGPFHAGAVAGFATLRWDNPFAARADESLSLGVALGPEIGVEGYAGEGWWIGASGRLLAGRTFKETDAERHTVIVPTLVVTVCSVGAGRKKKTDVFDPM
jgi:hypothetical protein